jgi:hypothetical protein
VEQARRDLEQDPGCTKSTRARAPVTPGRALGISRDSRVGYAPNDVSEALKSRPYGRTERSYGRCRRGKPGGHGAVQPCSDLEALRPPRTRAECLAGPRPCRRYLCVHHMVWIVRGPVLRQPLAKWPLTCQLDAPPWRDDMPTLNDIGVAIGVTRERVRQIEDKALGKLKRLLRRLRRQGHE